MTGALRLERVLGAPVTYEELKHRPGRRRTMRAVGPRRRAIVKVYQSERAPVIAARLRALGDGPAEPVVPRVIAVDAATHTLVVSEVPGVPFRGALVAGDRAACERVGRALAAWHGHWRGSTPARLADHTAERELEILSRWADRAPDAIAAAVRARAAELAAPWACSTVVHRDLYEEQILLDGRVGLIDLDDAAIGPAELDVGNLWAHVDLLGHRRDLDLGPMFAALLNAYTAAGGRVDPGLLRRCRGLSRLRLACIHSEARLLSSPADDRRDDVVQ